MLSYKHRPASDTMITMCSIYKTLASQYDPLGYIVPFTTQAKILIGDKKTVGQEKSGMIHSSQKPFYVYGRPVMQSYMILRRYYCHGAM